MTSDNSDEELVETMNEKEYTTKDLLFAVGSKVDLTTGIVLRCLTCGRNLSKQTKTATYTGLNRIDDSAEVYHTFELKEPILCGCGKQLHYYMEEIVQ